MKLALSMARAVMATQEKVCGRPPAPAEVKDPSRGSCGWPQNIIPHTLAISAAVPWSIPDFVIRDSITPWFSWGAPGSNMQIRGLAIDNCRDNEGAAAVPRREGREGGGGGGGSRGRQVGKEGKPLIHARVSEGWGRHLELLDGYRARRICSQAGQAFLHQSFLVSPQRYGADPHQRPFHFPALEDIVAVAVETESQRFATREWLAHPQCEW